jgi:hypothetical protein
MTVATAPPNAGPNRERKVVVIPPPRGTTGYLVLTRRDEELLLWVARFGPVTREQIGRRFFPSMKRCYRRVLRLQRAGLLRGDPAAADVRHVVRTTNAGIRTVGGDLRSASLDHGRLRHNLSVVDLSERLLREYPGSAWITERELRRDRMRDAHGDPDERQRRTPDGVLILTDGRRVAIELDLTAKRTRQLDQLARAYALERELACVWWYLPSEPAAARMRSVVATLRLDRLIEPRSWQKADD